MKRNKLAVRTGRAGQSPYHRYGKRPYRYSDALRAWERKMGRKAQEDTGEQYASER